LHAYAALNLLTPWLPRPPRRIGTVDFPPSALNFGLNLDGSLKEIVRRFEGDWRDSKM